ncbi:hypothetical protein ACQY0O_003575 [Thecaphora frezii]
MQATHPAELDLDSLNNLEERAYLEGFRQGHDHGQLHGTFEGRELGRDKGFEVWEEVGFYQGTAKTWRSLIEASAPADKLSRKQSKQLQHLCALERLTAAFPMQNRSSEANEAGDTASAVEGQSEADGATHGEGPDSDEDLSKLDMLALLERIRARYRLACSVLGVRPRGAGAPNNAGRSGATEPAAAGGGFQAQSKSVLVGGRMVDPTQLRY